MKHGWHTKKLREIASAVSTGPFGSMLHKSDYSDTGIPLINPINIVDDGIVPDQTKLLSDETKERLSHYVLQEGDIVVARRGEIGRCAEIGPEEAGWICGTGCFFIRPLPGINSRFLVHLIRSKDYREKLELASTGTTMKSLSNTSLSDLIVPIPPSTVQKRIVGILDEAFAGIASVKSNARNCLINAHEISGIRLRQIFAKFESQWPSKKLGNLTEVQSGGTPSVSEKSFWTGDIPWYSSGELNTTYTGAPQRKISLSGLENSNAKLFPKGSLLIGMYDTAALKMSILDRDAAFNQAIAGVKSSEHIDLEFVLLAITAKKPELLLERRGVRQKNLSLGKIKEISIPLPSIQEQRDLSSQLRTLSTETQRLAALYQSKLAALDELKQSLLHQAFSGAL